MLQARDQIQGLYRRRRRGCTVRNPNGDPFPDLVNRDVTADGPNPLWLTDITEYPTREESCTDRDVTADGPNPLWLTDITVHPTREESCTAPRL